MTLVQTRKLKINVQGQNSLVHYEKNITKNIRPTDILQICTSMYLVNVLKFTKYLVNSYHQRGNYFLTN